MTVILAGCGGYTPVRWPTSDLWTPQEVVEPTVQLPTLNLKAYPIRLEQRQVTLAVRPLNASSTVSVCGLDLHARQIQPLLLFVENRGTEAYQISRRNFSPSVIPASRVARAGQQHPIITIANHLRWLVWLGPGIMFSSIIEPLTTFDFPGVHELASRPAWPRNRQVAEAFVAHELRETALQPGQSMQGLWFVKTPTAGATLTLTLLPNTAGGESLTLTFAIPVEPGAIPTHTYADSYPHVWDTVVRAAQHIPGWRIAQRDDAQGRLRIRKGVWLLRRTRATLQVEVRKTTETSTDVTVARVEVDGLAAPGSMRSIELFFEQLDAQLQPFVPVLPARAIGNTPTPPAGAY